jgi:predicted ATPase
MPPLPDGQEPSWWGENGSGKSTVVGAIAGAGGFNPEGGSTACAFATRS